MKQEKQEKFKWFTMENGKRVRFDWTRFRDEVDKITREQRLQKKDVYRQIIRHLKPGLTRDEVEDKTDRVKKWYQGDNGPRDLLEIYKPLAEFFRCEETAFLLFEKTEDYKMETIITPLGVVQANSQTLSAEENRKMIYAMERARSNAMERAKEKEVAYELYGVLVDLIAAYVPVDHKVWLGNRDEPGWVKIFKEYPGRYPAEVAIRKSAPYLPKEIRYQASALLEEMYGGWLNDWEFSIGDFHDSKIRQLDKYIEEIWGEDPKKMEEGEKEDRLFDFILDEEYNLFAKLDDIFADYLCD